MVLNPVLVLEILLLLSKGIAGQAQARNDDTVILKVE